MEDPRLSKLISLLDSILYGRKPLIPSNSSLFIEAICAQPDPAACIAKLIGSPTGLSSVQACMRFNIKLDFLNGSATALLRYLQAPVLKTIAGGDPLTQVLLKIVDPPIFWAPFSQAFKDELLHKDAQLSFAWLLLQLISLSGDAAGPYREFAQDPLILEMLSDSPLQETRTIASKIKQIVAAYSTGNSLDGDYVPGGRHDNDCADFRDIAILPTADEITSSETPFLRPIAQIDDLEESARLATYLDTHFRLLREDMIYEMREELQIALKKKKGYHRGLVIEGFTELGIHYEKQGKKCKWGITLRCEQDLPQFKGIKPNNRKKHLAENRKILKHQSLACLLIDDEIATFATVNRDEDRLILNPPVIVLQLEGQASTIRALVKLKTAKIIKLIQIDTAVFSFEPILKALQAAKTVPLSAELLLWKEDSIMNGPSSQANAIIHAIRADPRQDLKSLLKSPKSIKLDNSQMASLLAGLTQNVTLIQGPPGTGKSFIGALLAKVLHDSTTHTILVVCYTNHALDQFLEDLLDIGIPEKSMVRLGGKSTPRTEPLTLQNQTSNSKPGKADWATIQNLKSASENLLARLQPTFRSYKSGVQYRDLLEHLEFEDSTYFEAFRVPKADDGMTRVGKNGQAVQPHDLIDRWTRGQDAGMFRKEPHIMKASEIWKMPHPLRQGRITKWKQAILKTQVADIYTIAKEYNDCQSRLDRIFGMKNAAILNSKRVIGCTTTAAAKYSVDIQSASPGVLIVEESGEIMESHCITAMGEHTEQLILIGDHKQLRPKVNHYKLTVEKGEGFDLNRSLFERLVLKGYPHETLTVQHRMRPEISDLIRQLTYPDLVDAPGTKNRPDLRGIQDNIVFINHTHPEDEAPRLADRRDMNSTSSKQNSYEIEMVLKIVRYLAQQGYGTEKIVILTPYLGQLQKLQAELRKDNDPILSDLDSYDLVRAGLLPEATAKLMKKPIRLSTIDNYQGEESDIVIVTLTRSNPDHEIGFMSSPERLNVLLSRARDALILIGNADTFLGARKGRELWTQFLNLLKGGKHVYDGLPVKCEQHPDRLTVLSRPVDFDEECPDGGCKEPCGVKLNCGLHFCPSKCHQLYDHSKMPCESIISLKCLKGHNQSRKCHENPPNSCKKCDRDTKIQEEKRKKEFALQQKRDADQLEHARKMAELDAKIAAEAQIVRDAQLDEERKSAILQKEKDLEAAVSLAARASSASSTSHAATDTSSSTTSLETTNPTTQAKPTVPRNQHPKRSTMQPAGQLPIKSSQPAPSSPSREEWKRQKDVDGASNDAIDAIMDMIGLEEVKQQVLKIKAKIEMNQRQNTLLKGERFNVVLLGNPGTGKTTVARHYAKFLASMQVLPGNEFVETTGSRLANDGVAGIKKIIEDVVNAGGGTIFVDEAYQLADKHNFQGSQVLDFMLAEMENKVGTIVFILAGYNKQMEKFFEHNPGLTSRVPYQLQFADYTDSELMRMLEQLVDKKYGGRMRVEDGINGLYSRIAVKRLGRGRGQDGFGNARALQNMFSKISERQAERLNQERKEGLRPDDFLLLKEDLIGPDLSEAETRSAAWEKLKSLIGLNAVKESIRNLFSLISANYMRELQEKEPVQMSLNRVFLGSPGTGKTTVAKLYGQILADLGLLSNGEVIIKNPADFIGAVLGESESKTKAILSNTIGKVLIIDEAYMLYGGGNTGNQNDPYKTAVIDTIVAEVQSVPGEDRCVLLLGYKEQIEEMFQNVNAGLSRRFAIENAFHFQDFSDSELLQILNLKLKNQDLDATDAAKNVAIEVLSRARQRLNFGNAGEVENLLTQAQGRYQTRQASLPVQDRSLDIVFEPRDFDANFDRNANASDNLSKLFEDVVGCERIVQKLGEYQRIARAMKVRNMDMRDQIPTNFIFKGPPGTGKTTTARKMGQVYYDMGFLSSTDVMECSASDLVGQYVGHTGPKTKKVFERALGRVLFVDEAYRLGEGPFAKEAIDELVGVMTQETFMHKVVVILAGYDQEMNMLMAVNTGLSSRFPEEVVFEHMAPAQCLELLNRELKKKSIHFAELGKSSSVVYMEMEKVIVELTSLPSWGNARDMKTIAQQMTNLVFAKMPEGVVEELTLSGRDALTYMRTVLKDRRERSANLPANTHRGLFKDVQPMHNASPPPPPSIRTHATNSAAPAVKEVVSVPSLPHSDDRDIGVTDEIWHQLQVDKQAAETAAKQSEDEIQLLEERLRESAEKEAAQQAQALELARTRAGDATAHDELKRKREEARLRECEAIAERSRIAAMLEEKQKMRQQEAEAQGRLREMGVCSAGYRWIKQDGGYRCAGGAHFVTDGELGI